MKNYCFAKLTYYPSLWLTVVVLMLVAGASQVQAHQTSSNGCYHPTNQWVSCCGANYCAAGGDLVNDCLLYYYTGTSGYPTGDANHLSGSGRSWIETHQAESPDCPLPATTCTSDPTTCTAPDPVCPTETTYGLDNCDKTCPKTISCAVTRVSIGGQITNTVTGLSIPGVIVNQGITSPRVCNIGTAVTDTSGNYRFNDISQGLSFCLRPPTLIGYTGPVNSADSRLVSYENQTAGSADRLDYNFTYTSANFIIGGNIKDGSNNLGIPGVIVNDGITTPPLCKIGKATSAANGDYRFNNVSANLDFCLRPPPVTGYLTPSPPAYENVTAIANHTTYNFSYTPKVTLSCANATVNQGSSVNSTVTINRNAAVTLTQTVSIRATASPAPGITFNTPACEPDCTTPLTITTGATAALGAHTITITGSTADTGGSFSRSATCTLTVNTPPTTPDFSLANSGNCSAIQGGGNSSCSTIAVIPVAGFTSAVSLTVAAPTDGTVSRNGTASIFPTSLASADFATGATLNVTATGTCATYPCNKTIIVTGTSGTLTHTTTVTLTVTAPGVVIPPPPPTPGTGFIIIPLEDIGDGIGGVAGDGIKNGTEACFIGSVTVSFACTSASCTATRSPLTFTLDAACTASPANANVVGGFPSSTTWRLTITTLSSYGTNVIASYEPTPLVGGTWYKDITIP